MKKVFIFIIILTLIFIIFVVFENIKMINSNSDTTKSKIKVETVLPKEVNLSFGNIQYLAPNSFDNPSKVIARRDNKIIWQKELVIPEVNPNLEKDAQLLDYFITRMEINEFKFNDALYVTLGSGIKAKTYILNIENGDLLDLIIISPPALE